MHVKPWIKRTEKFKRNLWSRLKAAPPEADRFQIAEKYRQQWAGAQGAWTKVPVYSDEVSQTITMTYVADFLKCVPMGILKLNKAKIQEAAVSA